jgi:hypothetical protein
MNFARVEEIANAVLYEGYMLYPYRPSAVKNRQRWNFGVLCPPAYCEIHSGSECSGMQTQCLVRTNQDSRLKVKLRFLQIVERRIARDPDHNAGCAGVDIESVACQPWQEAAEREVTCAHFDPALFGRHTMSFAFPAGSSQEELSTSTGTATGAMLREWQALAGTIEVVTEQCRDDLVKVSVRVQNRTAFQTADAAQSTDRNAVMPYALASAHILLGVEDGEFLSSLDPPAEYRDAVAQCENVGAWPVLAGDDATTMLASPIILYDYPQIAPESAGNLFDGTEIDEILSLRILTLTDQEKEEIRQSDERARELLERTESIPAEQFLKLHGVLRGLNSLQEESK